MMKRDLREKTKRNRGKNEPFSTLFKEHRYFDVAEMLRGGKCDERVSSEIDKIFEKIRECISEISSKIKNNVSIDLSNIDYISGLDELLRAKYEEKIKGFIVLAMSTDSIDLGVRGSGVKGVLRWALEKYFIFALMKYTRETFKTVCQAKKGDIVRKMREVLLEFDIYLPNLVFGHQGRRSSINFWVEDGKVRYSISPPSKVSRLFLEYGVPVKCHEAVLRYYLAVAVTMLNPLDCYMGEPAVPIVRRRSYEESTRVIMYSRDFDYECGMSYGEELINRLACKLAEELPSKLASKLLGGRG